MYQAVDQQPPAAIDCFGQRARGRGFFRGEGIVFRRGRHRGQHRHIGVAVDEYLADEVLGREAFDRAVAAACLRKEPQNIGPAVGEPAPCPVRIHMVGLNVEDEVAAAEHGFGRGRLESCGLRDGERSAAPASTREYLVKA